MNKKYFLALILAGTTLIMSCNSGSVRRNPGKIYAPDMVYSRAYDAYTENPVFANKQTSQLAVKGTIARGHALPLHLDEDDLAGYKALDFPKKYNEEELAQGQRLWDIHCGICHGGAMDGQGPLFKSGKFASMPANLVAGTYYLELTPGQIYHTIQFGKNMMGSYYSQLNEQERWEVIAYIKKVQAGVSGASTYFMEGSDDQAATPKNEEPSQDENSENEGQENSNAGA